MTQLHPSSFDEKKAAEVAYFFLSRATSLSKNITKLRLVKWMYLVERLSYQKYGEPLTGDRLYSMEHGPILSTTLSLMEHPERVQTTGEWASVVAVHKDRDSTRSRPHTYAVIVESCPYSSEDDLLSLSNSELRILNEVWEEHGEKGSKELETLLHSPDDCPEWQWKRGDKSNPIELESLLPNLGYSEDQIELVVEQITSMQAANQAFKH